MWSFTSSEATLVTGNLSIGPLRSVYDKGVCVELIFSSALDQNMKSPSREKENTASLFGLIFVKAFSTSAVGFGCIHVRSPYHIILFRTNDKSNHREMNMLQTILYTSKKDYYLANFQCLFNLMQNQFNANTLKLVFHCNTTV